MAVTVLLHRFPGWHIQGGGNAEFRDAVHSAMHVLRLLAAGDVPDSISFETADFFGYVDSYELKELFFSYQVSFHPHFF